MRLSAIIRLLFLLSILFSLTEDANAVNWISTIMH
jgi:hypothetical protein